MVGRRLMIEDMTLVRMGGCHRRLHTISPDTQAAQMVWFMEQRMDQHMDHTVRVHALRSLISIARFQPLSSVNRRLCQPHCPVVPRGICHPDTNIIHIILRGLCLLSHFVSMAVQWFVAFSVFPSHAHEP